jgi:magnesium chelatase subunit D
MSAASAPAFAPWSDARLAAALFAIDPAGTLGIALRARSGPVRDRWIALLRECLPTTVAVHRLPLNVSDSRLLGGLDLPATLRAGRPIAERGLLAHAHGGVVLLAMAERQGPAIAARIGAALDAGEVAMERDGLALRFPAQFGVVALDEGAADDERPPGSLLDRLAFHLELTDICVREAVEPRFGTCEIAAARERLPSVGADVEIVAALCATAVALGIGSIRPPLLALRAARAAAALAGRESVSETDAALAARLVFAARATTLPAPEQPQHSQDGADQPERSIVDTPHEAGNAEDAGFNKEHSLEEIVLAATQAAIPAHLLRQLRLADVGRARSRSPGRSGVAKNSARRGRPTGVQRGEPRAGARLNVVETLRAAAPWQAVRRRDAGGAGDQGRLGVRIEIRREDFRVTRFRERSQTTTVFVVDASGSAALHRLAEAKGAVELLLADCYVRRDQVALLAFRGAGAELLLPPTRSLVRAKRSLAGLPGGGGTPLAAGIDAALALAEAVRRRGDTPIVIFLTDGRANIARDGSPERARAEQDARASARRLRAASLDALVVDTSPRPDDRTQRVATEMGARYLALPLVDAASLARAVRERDGALDLQGTRQRN